MDAKFFPHTCLGRRICHSCIFVARKQGNMAPRKGRAAAAPIIFQMNDFVSNITNTSRANSSAAPDRLMPKWERQVTRERSRSAPLFHNQQQHQRQPHNDAARTHTHGSEASSRASSLTTSVGFLLARARQQKMSSLSTKRSRSSSTVRQASLSQPQHYNESLEQPTSWNHQQDARDPRDGSQRRTALDNYNRGRGAAGSEPRPRKSSRHEKEFRVQDGSSHFTGLASIPLDPMIARHISDIRAEQSSTTRDAVPANARVQPVWVLIGTFKTSMDTIVRMASGSLQWHQRNPKGGFQSMQVALSLITEVSCARVAVSQDETSTFSVIIKTAGKPSQITFGFIRVQDAVNFKALLVQVIQSTTM